MIETYERAGLTADVIVPVPLTGMGRRLRGYNQAALLANELSKATGVPVLEALSRKRSVKQQARSASADERRRNVEGAFEVRRGADIGGQTVLLIDDVATTCATLDACARELLQVGQGGGHAGAAPCSLRALRICHSTLVTASAIETKKMALATTFTCGGTDTRAMPQT